MYYSCFVHTVEGLFPKSIVEYYRKKKAQCREKKHRCVYNRIVRKIKKKERPIIVLFFALDSNTWKYDSLFQAMQKDPVFSPTVLAVPQVNKGKDFMLYQLKHGCEYYKSKGYPTVCSYNEETDSYVDAFSLHPDVIFFSNPYNGLVDDRYNIRHFANKALTCYVNYGFTGSTMKEFIASVFHQKVWRYYCETEESIKSAKAYYSAGNCVCSGYPVFDIFESTVATGKDWKLGNEQLKRVIWAPHHTIEGQTQLIQYSTFLLYYDFMLHLAEEYKDKIQVVFKPHPLLKPALYVHPDWGKERTDAYYERWANGDNTAYVNGDYVDLFKSSDAMIHDCGSFFYEYLYFNKPVMYLDTFGRVNMDNNIVKNAYKCHYIGKSENDIRGFVEKVVIGGEDSYKEKRKSFYDEYLLPPNGITVAENIINDLKKALD
jgi:CDP-glycerol glycerophosphotransferase (TagB/SpsB family)